MQLFTGYAVVFFGAGIGGMLRHAVNQVARHGIGSGAAVPTLLVNVVGSLAIGALAGYLAVRGHASQGFQLFLATGLLGGFTTFSAFSLEAALLWQRGQVLSFVLYTLGSVTLSITAAFVGLGLARMYHPV